MVGCTASMLSYHFLHSSNWDHHCHNQPGTDKTGGGGIQQYFGSLHRGETMGSRHHIATPLRDIHERVKVLEKAGHFPLAYVTAAVHGLKEDADRIVKELGDNVPSLPQGKVSSLLISPAPVLSCGDWPLLRVMKGIFEGGLDNMGKASEEVEEDEALDADWVEDLDIDDVIGLQNGNVKIVVENGETLEENDKEGGWDLEDLELPPEVATPKDLINGRSSLFTAPTLGMPVTQIWIRDSSLAGEHAAAGNFDTVMRLLTRQLGIKNFTNLKTAFLDLYVGSQSYLRAFDSAPVISLEIEKGWSEDFSSNVRCAPALVLNFSRLDDKLRTAYKATTDGKFTEALRLFLNILQTIPLIVVDSRREVDEVKELIVIAKEYVIGLQMELMRKEIKDDITCQQELAAYFTHCNL